MTPLLTIILLVFTLQGYCMKPHEYRAYNNVEKEMRNVERIHFDERIIYVTPDYRGESKRWMLDYCDLMQFTHIYDIRKNPIYADDIVRFNKLYGNGTVYYEDGSYSIIVFGSQYLDLNSVNVLNYGIEIIGNTYQNPELQNDTIK